MSTIFGPNWKTTVYGWITALSAAIAVKPDLIAFLPDSFEKTVSGIAGLIAIVAGGTFAAVSKDRNVTGGTVPQTPEAEGRVEEPIVTHRRIPVK
jgi:hypothetical protein